MPNLKNKKVIKDQQGQRKYPGRVTEIQGNTMATTGYGDIPLYVVPNVGNPMVVPANSGNRVFPGASSFTEYPIAKNGGWLEKYQDGGKTLEDNDSWLENIAEIADPTGISSWDDVYRAYKNKGIGKEVALELLGSIPLLGKVKKAGRLVDDLANAFAITKRQKNNAKITSGALKGIGKYGPSAGRVTDAVQAVLGSKDNSGFTSDIRHGEVPKYGGRNIFPQIELGEHGDYAYGGWLEQYGDGGETDPPVNLRSASTQLASAVSTQAPEVPLNKTGWDWVKQKYENKQPSEWNMLMMDKLGSYVDSGVDPFSLMLTSPQQVIKAGIKGGKVLLDASKSNKIKPSTLQNVENNEYLNQLSTTLNLQRQGVKNKKIMQSFDDVDLGNDLTLRNNPSRVSNKEDIIGKNKSLVSVKNKKTNEYIDLKSWKDPNDGEIYYYMSANMPSSKIKAGKAYIELEKHIPKGKSLLENSSLSYDSFLNILKQTKNPKFESFVKGHISMNDMSVTNKLKSIGDKISDDLDLGFYNKEIADKAVNELNVLISKYNLPEAKVVQKTLHSQPAAHLPYESKKVFKIELPNVGLKKLYSIIGISAGSAALQNKQDNSQWLDKYK